MLTRFYSAAFTRALMLSDSLRRLTLRGLCAYAVLISPLAKADGDVADMLKNVAEGAKSGQTSILTIAQFAGVVGVIGSLVALKSMKSNPQVKPWHVGLAATVSLLLIVIPEIIRRGQTQMGMTPVSVG